MKGIQDMAFLSEIVLQSKIAKRAAERLELTKDIFDNIEVWCSVQSILVAAGNVSKILSPPGDKYKERGERMRKILNVGDDNILLNRNFRNNFFEHYDSRIEEWYREYPNGPYVDLEMNPLLWGETSNCHRGYNSFNDTLIFRENILDLKQLLIELDKLYKRSIQFVLDYP